MKRRRVALVVAAVLVPLAVLGVVLVRRGGATHPPARLPIVAAKRSSAGGPSAPADAALGPYGGIVYQAGPGVPALDGSMHAYRVRTGDVSAAVGRLATALGLPGDPSPNGDGGYALTDGDAQLTVSPPSWSYSRTSVGGAVSSSGVAVACPLDAPDCPSNVTAPPPSTPPRPADLPSQDDAKAAALALLEHAGVTTRDASVTVDDGGTQWFVSVDPEVDGVATEGFGSSVSVGPKGEIEYASGVLGEVAVADDYPLVGTRTAIDRLNSGFGLVGPQPLGAGDAGVPAAGAPAMPAEPAEPPAAPIPEPSSTSDAPPTSVTDTIPPPTPQTVTLTGAERILLFATSTDGNESWLVPAYRFTTADGPGPSVIAVDDRFLTPPDALQPAVKPLGVPTVASDGGR
jgi:hypothetical protein